MESLRTNLSMPDALSLERLNALILPLLLSWNQNGMTCVQKESVSQRKVFSFRQSLRGFLGKGRDDVLELLLASHRQRVYFLTVKLDGPLELLTRVEIHSRRFPIPICLKTWKGNYCTVSKTQQQYTQSYIRGMNKGRYLRILTPISGSQSDIRITRLILKLGQ